MPARFRRMAALLVAALCFACATIWAPAAWAQPKTPVAQLIQKGQDHFDEQEYELSIQVLSAALIRPEATKDEKVRIFTLLAFNYIVLQKEVEAEGAVRGLYTQDCDYKLPETESPRFRDFFEKVRKDFECVEPPKPVVVRHKSPAQVEPDAVVLLDGEIDDPSARVAKVKLHYRTGSEGAFKEAAVKYAVRKFSAEIPSEAVQTPQVEYYVEALDEGGLPLAGRGDATSPLVISVSTPGEGGSVTDSPWFWVGTIGGGLAVIAAVVIPIAVVASTGEATVSVGVFE